MIVSANVLITSAAAKVLLVEAFVAAAVPRGGKVVAADVAEDCAAGHFAQVYERLPPTSAPEAFMNALEELCERHAISLIVPTRDGELELMAAARERFSARGVRIVVSPPDAIALCRDKLAFTRFLEANGLPVLPALDPRDPQLRYPVFVRPRSGAGGRQIRRIDAPADLSALEDLDGYIFNRYVDPRSAQEFTIDVLMSFDGLPLQAVVRSRDSVVGGESKISTVVEHPVLEKSALDLGARLGLVGHNTMQAFLLEDGEPSFIEINPRFGGASNLSIAAGLDSAERIVAMHLREPGALEPRAIRIGARMLRYSRDVIVF